MKRPGSHRLAVWENHLTTVLDESARDVAWSYGATHEFIISSPSTSRTATIRLVHEELIYSELSDNISAVRVEDQSDDECFLEYADELVEIGTNYVIGEFRTGRERSRQWIEIPFHTAEGRSCRERIFRNVGLWRRLLGPSSTIINDDVR